MAIGNFPAHCLSLSVLSVAQVRSWNIEEISKTPEKHFIGSYIFNATGKGTEKENRGLFENYSLFSTSETKED